MHFLKFSPVNRQKQTKCSGYQRWFLFLCITLNSAIQTMIPLVSGCFSHSPLQNLPDVGDGGHCARWDLQGQKPFPRSVLGGLQTVPLTSWFVVGPALSDRDMCEPFHIVSNQLNLAPVDSNRIVETLETGRS